jgi:cell division protein FtsB
MGKLIFQIAELKLRVEELNETIENRDQQIEQLRERKLSRGSPVEGIEFESDREVEKQIEALKRENKQLRVT